MKQPEPVWSARDKHAVRGVFVYWSPRYPRRSVGKALREAERVLNTIGKPAEWGR